MTLLLSATRLVRYATCPRAYAWKYRYHYPEPGGGGKRQRLGILLHSTLHRFWQDWMELSSPRTLEHLEKLWWRLGADALDESERKQGWLALDGYFRSEVAIHPAPRPFASEGRLRHGLAIERVDVQFESRYDLLLWAPSRHGAAQIDLVEFKTARQVRPPAQLEADLQLSCYILGLQATYGQALRSVSHYYLLTGEKISFRVQPYHQDYARRMAGDLVEHLLENRAWEAAPGKHCKRCGYRPQCDLSRNDQPPPGTRGQSLLEEPLVLTLF